MRQPEINKLRIRFFVRVILPGILTFCLFAALILGYLIPGFERAMMERKQETTRELTRSAWSILEHYQRLVESGSMTRQEAMTQAGNAVRELRYGDEGKDYFWITDRQPVMIMHPYRPDLDGKDLSDFRDPDGKALFVEFVRVTNQSGDGFVDYRWQWKDDPLRIVPKLSYVRLFEPWGWIIGTGIYIEDVRVEIRRMETSAMLISGGIGILISILLIIITRQSHRIEMGRRKAEQELLASHERYKALAEAASEGVLIWSGQGLHANKTLLAWLGLREEELSGYRLDQLIPGAGLERFTTPEIMYDELTARMYIECSLVGNGESPMPVHADFSRIEISGGQAVMLVARPLQVSKDLVEVPFTDELLDHTETGLFRTPCSKQGRLIKVNEQFLKLFGLARNEIGQTAIGNFFSDPREYKLYISMLEESGIVLNLPVRIRRSDGRMMWVILNAVAMDDESGEKWYEGSVEHLTWTDAPDLLPAGELSGLNIPVHVASGSIADIRTFEELQDAWSGMPDNILRRISEANSAEELKEEYQISAKLSGSLIEGRADPYLVVRFISRIADAICKRSLDLLLAELAPPPATFAVMQLGSAGRGEQTLATDQDNAILFDDVPESQVPDVQSYFVALGVRLNSLLDEIGYQRCKGDVMAGNPRWCLPLRQWKSCFSNWTRNPGPDELLEMSIFFDFAYTAGNAQLVENLRDYVKNELKTNDIYFHHMASAWKPFTPEKHLPAKIPVNLKKLQMPLTGVIRLYALRHSLDETGTMEQCISLYKSGVLSKEILQATIQAWKTLVRLRLAGQHQALLSGEIPGNQLDPALISPEMRFLLENAIQGIEILMLKAGVDFHTNEA